MPDGGIAGVTVNGKPLFIAYQPLTDDESWTCECGIVVSARLFCPYCGFGDDDE